MAPRKKPAIETYRSDPDVVSDFTADGVRYTVRQSLMSGAIDRELHKATGYSFEHIHRELGADDAALWMIAAMAFVATRQAGVPTSFGLIETKFPYDRPILFEWWPPIGEDAGPKAPGAST